jgi:protein-L-isoaspartate(D-aspartate) O-methyltransferase
MNDQSAIRVGTSGHDPIRGWGAPRLAAYARKLRMTGAIEEDAIEEAFASVPRHRFLTRFRHHRWYEVPVDGRIPDDVLAVVYDDNPLALKLDEVGELLSSTTLPSLLARMLTALKLAPGMRILEIGAGIGYNAALIHAITGAEVITLDVQPDAIADATSALRRCGVKQVRAVLADGYLGYPEAAPYDRIIASCGIRGMSPAWCEQLMPDGFVVAPFAHGGAHPLVRFQLRDGSPHATAIGPWTDFMLAGGPLYQSYPGAHPIRFAKGPYPAAAWCQQVISPLEWSEYTDLWFYLAAHSPSLTQVRIHGLDPRNGTAALVSPTAVNAAVLQVDGYVHATGPDAAPLADFLAALATGWTEHGRPRISDWSTSMRHLTLPAGPLFVPVGWSMAHSVSSSVKVHA